MAITQKYRFMVSLLVLALVVLFQSPLHARPHLQKKLGKDAMKLFDDFGAAVATSDDFVVVGSPGKKDEAGEACIFQRELDDWVLDTCLTPVSVSSGGLQQIGNAVAISDNRVAISATHFSKKKHIGAVYIFERKDGSWIQIQELLNPITKTNNFFGVSLSLSGKLLAVGSPGRDGKDGTVYVYREMDNVWSISTKIVSDSDEKSKYFGTAVALSGNYLIVGDSEFGKKKEGAAYIYHFDNDVWFRQATLKGGAVTRGADYGGAVAISEHYAVVAAKLEDDPVLKECISRGTVHVYLRDGKNWNHHIKLTASDGTSGDNFGSSVSMSRNYIAVGSDSDDFSKGSTVLFRLVDEVWQEEYKLLADDGAPEDNFGNALSLSENHLTVGAFNKGSKENPSGEAYVFLMDIEPENTQEEIDLENMLDQLEDTLVQLDKAIETATVDPNDLDGDGLSNDDEINILGTDPNNADTDNDGLTDQEEVTVYQSDPLLSDTDADGLTDLAEIILHNSDPNMIDTDGDGFTDSEEVNLTHTDPALVDSDGDGFTDQIEINEMNTNPVLADTDGDGLSDNEEINIHLTDPLIADTDNDGFSDGNEVNHYDTLPLDETDFPTSTVQSTSYSPAENELGTMAFEDYWPSKGDYDFNDAVINYNVTETKINGLIKNIVLKLQPVARGASLTNSLKLLINTPISNIKSSTINVTEQEQKKGKGRGRGRGKTIKLDPVADGNRTLFNIIDDLEEALPTPEGFNFANTESHSPNVIGTEYTVSIKLKSPVDPAIFGAPPYNSFISRKLNNGEVIEVHFPGQPPSKRASRRQFGKDADNSDKDSDRYYQTKDNLPWAILIPYKWNYPVERVELSKGYPEILDWAASKGKKNKDWYKSKGHSKFVVCE
ncbi:MAG: LruC domain-containing protein [Pseudomonadales bacterium]|nr:LruC domain-containing protein [Pseudomonadales bacterium]